MLRWLNFLFIILLMTGCNSNIDQADEALKAGNYKQSVISLTNYLDEKGKFPGDKDTVRILAIMSNVVEHYQVLAENRSAGYAARTEGYEGLLFIRNRVAYKFYEPRITLTQRYNPADINKTLGELYYQWGDSISGNSKENHRYRAELFQKGMGYSEHKNIRELYKKNHKQYLTMQSEEYYQIAQQAVRSKDYQIAAVNYLKAAEEYKPYGSYKDSQRLGVQYDKLYRKNESNRLYQKATALTKTAKTRTEYRKIANIFKQSAAIYSQYGQVNNAQERYLVYQDKGIIKLYVSAQGDYSTLMTNLLTTDETKFTSSAINADIVLTLTTKQDFTENKKNEQTQNLREHVLAGQEALTNSAGETVNRDIYHQVNFSSKEIKRSNQLRLTASLAVTGELTYQQSYTINSRSESTEHSYSGDVPDMKKYKPRTEGYLKSKSSLNKDAQSELESELRKDINALMEKMKSL